MLRRIVDSYLSAYRELPNRIWLLALVMLINRSGTMVMPFFALYATAEQGLSVITAGQLLSVYGMGGILGSFLGGILTGWLGAGCVMVCSLLLTSGGFLLLLLADGTVELAACLFFLSLAAESVRPAVGTAIACFAPSRLYSRAFALNRLAANLGMSIGPVIGGLLAEIGFEYLFYADAATSAVAGLYVLRAFGFGALPHHDATGETTTIARRSPWRDGKFLLVLLLLFFVVAEFMQIMSTFVLYLQQVQGFSKPLIGAMIGINTVTIVLTEMFIIRRTEHISRLRLTAVGSLLVAIAFGILPWGSGLVHCAIVVFILTFGEILWASPSISFISSRASSADRGAYLGMYAMCVSLTFVLGPLYGTWLYEVSPRLLWTVSAVVACCSSAGFLLLASHEDRVRSVTAEQDEMPQPVTDESQLVAEVV